VNNIPPKICSYSCVYCQLGRTLRMRHRRSTYYGPGEIAAEVERRVTEVRAEGGEIDYITFVPDGEPTLDADLGREIDLVKPLGIPVAVITNSSLLGQEDVKGDLARADWVSVKVDSVQEPVWRKVDRPHPSLELDSILESAVSFASTFGGTLVTETMLVRGANDSLGDMKETAEFLARLKPEVAYLAVPTRPPAMDWVRPPGERELNRAYQVLARRLRRVELLVGYEGDAFSSTGDPERDILSITSVHPMREDAVQKLLAETGSDWSVVGRLLEDGRLVEQAYGGHRFYLRKLSRRPAETR